ncbi:MAG: hypothetical protein V4702_02720 [Patescibacteria group bacterium]
MRPFDPSALQLIRRFVMIIGFSFFVVFAYKATQDVSNSALAAGSPFRKKPPIASLSTQPIPQNSTGYQTPTSIIDTTEPSGTNQASQTKESANRTGDKSIKEKINPDYLHNATEVKGVDKKSIQER